MPRAETIEDVLRIAEKDPLCRYCPEELRQDARRRGFEYRDFPWMPEPVFTLLHEIMGEENYQRLAWSEKQNYRRGQFLIRPQGLENLREFVDRQ